MIRPLSSPPAQSTFTTVKNSMTMNNTMWKKIARFIFMLVLTYAPAGLAVRVLGVFGKGPLRFILALLLEPLFKRILQALFGRYAKESNEKTTKRA